MFKNTINTNFKYICILIKMLNLSIEKYFENLNYFLPTLSFDICCGQIGTIEMHIDGPTLGQRAIGRQKLNRHIVEDAVDG